MLMGDIFFRKNEFEQAVKYYNEFFQSTRQIDYLGIANYRTGLCHGFLGNDSLFQKHMLLTANGNDELPEDRYAQKKSKYYFENGLNAKNKKLLKSCNDLQAADYSAVIDGLKSIKEYSTEFQKGKRFIYLSEAYLKLENLEESLKFSRKALNLDYENAQWIIPYANYLVSEANFQKGNMEEAEKFLEKAEDENDYFYPPDLSALIENLEIRLKN